MVKEQSRRSSSSITIIDSFDNFYRGKNGNLNVESKLIGKRENDHERHLLDVNRSGFVHFNADYFVAKPHPPKNNGGNKCL